MPRALLRILVTCTSSRETPNPEAEGEFALIPWGGSSLSACGGRWGFRDSAAQERLGWPGLKELGWSLCERGLKQCQNIVTVKILEPGHPVSL